MIDFEGWKKNIYEALYDIADKDFQRRTWLFDSKEFSSPDEVYYSLIGDNVFEEFIEYPELNYNQHQKEQARQFIKIFENYYDSLPNDPDHQKIIDDPKWDIIGQKALKLIDTLDLGKYKNTNK